MHLCLKSPFSYRLASIFWLCMLSHTVLGEKDALVGTSKIRNFHSLGSVLACRKLVYDTLESLSPCSAGRFLIALPTYWFTSW